MSHRVKYKIHGQRITEGANKRSSAAKTSTLFKYSAIFSELSKLVSILLNGFRWKLFEELSQATFLTKETDEAPAIHQKRQGKDFNEETIRYLLRVPSRSPSFHRCPRPSELSASPWPSSSWGPPNWQRKQSYYSQILCENVPEYFDLVFWLLYTKQ